MKSFSPQRWLWLHELGALVTMETLFELNNHKYCTCKHLKPLTWNIHEYRVLKLFSIFKQEIMYYCLFTGNPTAPYINIRTCKMVTQLNYFVSQFKQKHLLSSTFYGTEQKILHICLISSIKEWCTYLAINKHSHV